MNIVELFSGIGSQAKALENLKIDHKVLITCDWDINAIIAYDIIHNGSQDLSDFCDLSDCELNEKISSLSISSDGKKPMTNKAKLSLNREVKVRLLSAIKRTNNKVDVTKINGDDLPENIDLLTYSFPCQDLSLAGNWHNNEGGINREAQNRSSLLWEVERILVERSEKKLSMPRSLMMENVSAILSKKHIENFEDWKENLEKLGYLSQVFTLNATKFNVPQTRVRTYMLSIYVKDNSKMKSIVRQMFSENNESNLFVNYPNSGFSIDKVLKCNYRNSVYRKEALESNPNDTISRRDIYINNLKISATTISVPTITTKQDRHPNSGVIDFKIGGVGKSKFRYFTPRECFILMGFEEEDYQRIIDNNFASRKKTVFFTRDKLNKMAGNSICVNVLEALFQLDNEILMMLYNEKIVKTAKLEGNKHKEYVNV